MTQLPRWMHSQTGPEDWSTSPVAATVCHRPRGTRFARQAAARFARLLADVLVDIGHRPGLLQRIDARAKVAGLLGLVVTATLLHDFATLGLLYGVCLSLAFLSNVPARRLLRVWLVVPMFTAAIMLPATLNIVTEGRHIWTLWHFTGRHFGPWALPETLAMTDAGLAFAGRFVLRTAVCVSLALLLASTTPHPQLFRGLRMLGVPKVFVMVLSVMHRYLGVVARAAEEIHLAKMSRSIVSGTSRQEQAWVAAGMGALFRRTRSLGNTVFLAMLSRGYTGEVRLLDEPRWRAGDWLFLGSAAALGALLLIVRPA